MSLAVWLGEDRKCSAAVVGLDLLLGFIVRVCKRWILSSYHYCDSGKHLDLRRSLATRLETIGHTK